MTRRKIPRLAAAFVVTIAAGCGEPREPVTPDDLPVDRPVAPRIRKEPDGTCSIKVSGNPPHVEPVPCPEDGTPPVATATAVPTTTVARNLPAAPAGWQVSKNADGTCTAYGPDPCQHSGCNPPPPMDVACPADMTGSP